MGINNRSDRELKPLRTEACTMEGAGTFIRLTRSLADRLRSAPAIRHSDSRAVDPAIRITTEHHSEVQLPEQARFLRLELRKIPHSGHESTESRVAAAISSDPHHGQTLPDAITSQAG